jgi:D-hexose-6-phosphate mutarotase
VAATLGSQAVRHDVVFWNAWVDKSRALADLDDDAYLRYVCIEPGTVSDFVVVPPGETLTLTQTLS